METKSDTHLIVCGMIFASEKEIFITKIDKETDMFLKDTTSSQLSEEDLQREIELIKRQFNTDSVKPLTYDYTSMLLFADEKLIVDKKIENIDSMMTSNSEFESMSYFRTLQAQFGNARNMSYSNDVLNIGVALSTGSKVSVYVIVAYSPNDFGKTTKMATIPHDNATSLGDITTPVEISDINSTIENLSIGASKPIMAKNVSELNNYLYPFEVELVGAVLKALHARFSGSVNLVSDNIIKYINLQELIEARKTVKSDEVIKLKVQLKEPQMVVDDAARSKQLRMEAIILPMGHGKTYLAAKGPYVDVDSLYDVDDVKLKELRSLAVKSGSWEEYNSYFDEILKSGFSKLDDDTKKNKVLLLHSNHMADVLGVHIQAVIVLNDEKLVKEAIKSRNGSDEDLKLAIRNRNDVLRDTKPEHLTAAASLLEVEKIVNSLTTKNVEHIQRGFDTKYSKAKNKGKNLKPVLHSSKGEPLYHDVDAGGSGDYLVKKK